MISLADVRLHKVFWVAFVLIPIVTGILQYDWLPNDLIQNGILRCAIGKYATIRIARKRRVSGSTNNLAEFTRMKGLPRIARMKRTAWLCGGSLTGL